MPDYGRCECKGLGPAGFGDLRGHFVGCPMLQRARISELEKQVADLTQQAADHERQLSDIWTALVRSLDA